MREIIDTLAIGVVTPERYFGAVVRYAGHSIIDTEAAYLKCSDRKIGPTE